MHASEEQVKKAAVEFLSHKGERPYRVTRRGAELWEDYVPAMRAALLSALAPVEPEPVACSITVAIDPQSSLLSRGGRAAVRAAESLLPASPVAPTPTEADDLVAALEPFSEFAGYLFSKNANDDDIVAQTRVSSEFGAAVATLTFKAFRRARNALALRNERTRAGGKP